MIVDLKDPNRKQWKDCRAKMTAKKPIPVKDMVTGELYTSIQAVINKFGLRSTGINHQLRDGTHPRFKKA